MSKKRDLKYWEKENLGKYFTPSKEQIKRGVYDSVSGKIKTAIPIELADLVRLHRLIRKRKSFTVLEFGVGFSTVIIADALKKNKADWQQLNPQPKIRNRFMFQCFSVDTSKKWIKATKKRLPKSLKDFVHFQYSKVEIGTYKGQLCHYYKKLPDVVPDFIYLDGPDPQAVKGRINGMSFQCMERTVMSADLLLMESIFLPGTFILIDGRTNNARFLKNNFKRQYHFHWDKKGDVTSIELKEERLGKYNLLGSDFF
ncbi:MAG TPA: hypothetical protein ENK52_05580 [Saprospiraceae bacterium]|nr:hypothetical protein [Saprospiraceae bacterium]